MKNLKKRNLLLGLVTVVFTAILAAGCGADDGLPADVVFDETTGELSIGGVGGGFGGGSALDPGDYSRCVMACLSAYDRCRENNGSDPDDVLWPCDWLYRLCLDGCSRD